MFLQPPEDRLDIESLYLNQLERHAAWVESLVVRRLLLPDWQGEDPQGDDDESHPPQFNEPEFGMGMDGEDEEED